jgi:hypothetical protein
MVFGLWFFSVIFGYFPFGKKNKMGKKNEFI